MAFTKQRTLPVVQWSKAQVFEHINGLQIGRFSFSAKEATAFRLEAITGRLLLTLEKDDLNTLGIDEFAKRNALYDHIQTLKLDTIKIPTVDTNDIFRGNMTPKIKEEHWESMAADHVIEQVESEQFLSPLTSPLHIPAIDTHSKIPAISNPPVTSSIPNRFQSTVHRNSSQNDILVPNLGVSRSRGMSELFDSELNVERLLSEPVQPRPLLMDSLSASRPSPFRGSEYLNLTEIRRVRDEDHLVDFPAIYQGANLHSRMFALITKRDITALNELYNEIDEFKSDSDGKSGSVRPQRTESVRPQRTASVPLQHFECHLTAEKVPFAWRLGTGNKAIKLPFNALVRCRLDLSTDTVMDIQPLFVSGEVGHINDHGRVWVKGDIQVKVREYSKPSNMVSNIISLDFTDLTNIPMHHRKDCSYMIHDPEDKRDYQFVKGQRVDFNLKVSTRSNVKDQNRIRLCFIQAWNPRPIS